jgi:hypothetical protein
MHDAALLQLHVLMLLLPCAPQGFQHDCGELWCAVARTPWGNIPGKANGDTCWYEYGGEEHETNEFGIVKQQRKAKPGSPHGFVPQGFQKDGAGYLWCAVARTPFGLVPGAAQTHASNLSDAAVGPPPFRRPNARG